MKRSISLIFGAMLLIASTAWSAPITYYGLSAGAGPGDARVNADAAATAFDAAAGALGAINIIDFEAVPLGYFPPGALSVAPGVSLTMSGTINEADAGITNVPGDAILGYDTTAGGNQFLRVVPEFGIGTAGASFSFATPIEAFGAYITGLGTAAGSLHVRFTDGTAQNLDVLGDGSGGALFFGFTDAGRAISGVDLVLTGVLGTSRDIFSLDDVRFVAVPEPASLLLLALGFAGVAAGARRRC